MSCPLYLLRYIFRPLHSVCYISFVFFVCSPFRPLYPSVTHSVRYLFSPLHSVRYIPSVVFVRFPPSVIRYIPSVIFHSMHVVFRDISFVISPRRPLPGMLADGGVHDIGMSIQRSAGSLSSYLDGKLMSTRFYEEVAWFPRYAFGTVILGFNGPQGYIKSVIPSPLYQVRYIKSIISNPSYRFRYIKSVISRPLYLVRYIKSVISKTAIFRPLYLWNRRPWPQWPSRWCGVCVRVRQQ